MADILLNILIFIITLAVLARLRLTRGKEKLREAFRYFTCLSNVLCAGTSLLMAAARAAGNVPEWVWILKYIGTAGVTVTMVTVFVYLAPVVGKDWVAVLLKGMDFFMHLLTPLLAIGTFCLLERRPMTFGQALLGMLPVVLYGPLYLYKTILAPEEKRWPDFYSFNKGGKWPAAFTGMLAGTLLICMAFLLAMR